MQQSSQQAKPHVYKLGNLWYCKHISTYKECSGKSPYGAYVNWLDMICKGY